MPKNRQGGWRQGTGGRRGGGHTLAGGVDGGKTPAGLSPAEALAELLNVSRRLEAQLLDYDPFTMLACLAYIESVDDPDIFERYEPIDLPAAIEYAALLYLKHPVNPDATKDVAAALPEVTARLRHALALMIHCYLTASPTGELTGRPDEACFATTVNEFYVRTPGYPRFLKRTLSALFGPFEAWLMANLGFSISDVIAIDNVVWYLIQYKIDLWLTAVQDAPVHDGRALGGLIASGLGAAYSLTSKEVAVESGLPRERVRSCLRRFSMRFNTLDEGFSFFSGAHGLRLRPFIVHGGRYLCPQPDQLLWAAQANLERALEPGQPGSVNRDPQLWQDYQRHRLDWVKSEGLRLLSSALGQSCVCRRLGYEVADGAPKEAGELDGLLVYDRTAFLVEARAGDFSKQRPLWVPSEESAAGREAALPRRAMHAKRYLESAPHPRFTVDDGAMAIDRAAIERIVPVVVALEPPNAFAATLNGLDRMSARDGPVWLVALSDLAVISDSTEFPAQLLHFIRRRLQVRADPSICDSELDWFGRYLDYGPQLQSWSDLAEARGANQQSRQPYMARFDEYYAPYSDNEDDRRRAKASKPRQVIPEQMGEMVRELEAVHAPGFSEVACFLLDMPIETRVRFAAMFDAARQETLATGGSRKFTLTWDEGEEAPSLHCHVVAPEADAAVAIRALAEAAKPPERDERRLGLLSVAGGWRLMDAWAIGRHWWEADRL